jgi:hypothetical protein
LQLGYLKKTLGSSKEEYAVPLAPPTPPTADQKELAAAFKDFGTRGGRDRGRGAVLFSPPPHGRALADSMVVRWRPWDAAGKVAIRIETAKHRELFNQGGIDGAGSYSSGALHAALRTRRRNDSEDTLILSIYPKGSTEERDQVQFKVLTPAEEMSLKHDLDSADKQESPLVRRIERGYAYSSRKLWTEAANEYEVAVKDSPDNVTVLERAIRAENETGNTFLAETYNHQLEKLIEDGAKKRP